MLIPYLALALGVAAAAGLLLWLLRRSARRSAPASPTTGQPLRALRTSEFMRLVGYAFQARGFNVVESGLTGAHADAAVTLELRKDRESYLVQGKHWKSRKIEVDAVRAFHALMTERRAAGGFIVTAGRFSRDATHHVRGLNLNLIDGALLGPLLDEGRHRGAAAAIPSVTVPIELPKPVEWVPDSVLSPVTDEFEGPADLAPQSVVEPPTAASKLPPRCPLCSASMELRTAPSGKHAGRGFWRCTRRRECKGVRPLV